MTTLEEAGLVFGGCRRQKLCSVIPLHRTDVCWRIVGRTDVKLILALIRVGPAGHLNLLSANANKTDEKLHAAQTFYVNNDDKFASAMDAL